MSEDPKMVAMPEGIDFNLPILNIKGEPMDLRNEDGTISPYRLGDVCVGVLCGLVPSEKIDGNERYRRFQLALRLQNSEDTDSFGTIKLKDAQKKMILDLAAKVINPQTGLPAISTLLYGRLHEILGGHDDDET